MHNLKLQRTMNTENRIPDCESVEDWARALFAAGLSFHLDDDPAEVLDGNGGLMFNAAELRDINAAVENFTEADRETFARVMVECAQGRAPMTLEQIKTAVRAGQTVHVSSEIYRVNLHTFPDGTEQWLIICTANDSAIGLTWADERTLNAEPGDFYIAS